MCRSLTGVAGGGEGHRSSRFDCSLSRLTKKFQDLVREAPGGLIDLNVAADMLGVRTQ